MQPALRMMTVPATNISSSRREGCPAAATQSAHNVGHSSSQMPIGRSSRMSCTKASSRRASLDARRGGSVGSGSSADASILLPLTDPAHAQRRDALSPVLLQQGGCSPHVRQQVGVP